MDTDNLVATAMPSGGYPVATMQQGGDLQMQQGKQMNKLK